ncbi:MAG: dockerin type I domain-containing protein, partial [Bacteroidota bacterium]|nr:dockerin type I domain-containing protein [Bacteroidota bacterium]
ILPGECECTIIPSFSFTNREVLKGFFLSLPDVASHFDVDNNGVFHVGNTTNDLSRFIISKPGYLSRTVDLPIGAAKNPIEMWAGDINEDGCINMSDIIIMGSGFNSESGSGNYNSICDFNQDQCINLSDIMIVASNFGKTRNDYPVYKAILY